MNSRIITISREFGSGGRTIGRIVAEKLGFAFYDREMVEAVAQKTGFAAEFIETSGEKAPNISSLLGITMLGGASINLLSGDVISLTEKVFYTQSNVIKELAEKGSCVIVGRCADDVLRARNDCLNVFIHSDMEHRKAHVIENYGIKESDAEKELIKKDRIRQSYYKHYTGKIWGMAQNYHLSIDSGAFGIEKSVDMIIGLISDK